MTSNLSQMSVRLANFFQTKCYIHFLEQNTAVEEADESKFHSSAKDKLRVVRNRRVPYRKVVQAVIMHRAVNIVEPKFHTLTLS